jgi:hypothetical protein
MAKHVLKTRLLSVITAVTLVAGISVAGTVTTSSAAAVTAASTLAPCTAPLFGPDKDCESTSPTVDRWVKFLAGDQSCTYTQFVDWGDGATSSRTFVNPIPDQYLIASHTYGAKARATTYTETVSTSVDSGNCKTIPTTVFKFTHLLPAAAPTAAGLQLTTECKAEFAGELASLGLEGGEALGLFVLPGGQLVGVLLAVGSTYLLITFIANCVAKSPASGIRSSATSSIASLPRLPHAFAYGAKHPGKRFKPAGKVPARPQVTGIFGYQKGPLVYFSITYADPGHDAKGFGFAGINGAKWALENHPFSKPSFGIVGHDRIDYPFNLGCGTSHQFSSYVEAWVYDSQGLRSNPVEVALTCTT